MREREQNRFGKLAGLAGRLLAPGLALACLVVAAPLSAQPPADPSGGAEPAPVLAQPGKVTLESSPDRITVGGRISVVVTAVWMGEEPASAARFPTWQETWGDAEVIEASEPEGFVDQSGRHVFRQTLELTAWEAGEVSLPAVTVAIPLTGSTVELRSESGARFEVTSVLEIEEGAEHDPAADPSAAADPGAAAAGDPAAATEPQPRPFAAPESLDSGWAAFWISSLAASFLLAAVLTLMARRIGAQTFEHADSEPADPLTLLPPLEELVERLARLDSHHPEPAHTGISLALRRFLGRHLDFPAVESTTTEIQRYLRRQTLPADLGQSAVQLLRDCDLVKFGGRGAEAPVTAQRLENARGLGRRIDSLLGPKLPAAAGDSEASADAVGRISA